MKAIPAASTYPPLEPAPLLRGIRRSLRNPASLGAFLSDGTVDEGLLLGGRHRSRLGGAAEPEPARMALLLHLGRGAVFLAAKRFAEACSCGGSHSAAVPAYHCGSEIEALVRAGFEPRFYRVRPDLAVDPESYREAAAGACIEYVISYFGLPPLVEGSWPADEEGKGVRPRPVIEDAAHALFSRYDDEAPIGSKGDAGIFSVRKSLGVVDGGALVMRGSAGFGASSSAASPTGGTLVARLRSVVSQSALYLAGGEGLLAAPAARLLSAFSKTEQAAAVGELEEAVYGFGEAPEGGWALPERVLRAAASRASLLTYFVLAGQWPEAVAAARRANYTRLLWEYGLAEFVPPVLRELPSQTTPLFLVVESDDRDSAVASFYEAGIRVLEVWPVAHRLTEERFDKELRPLRNRFIALPVHQALEASALERVGEVALRVLGRARK